MKYAKYISPTAIAYPTAEEFEGVINFLAHDGALRAKGYCPIANLPEEQKGKVLCLDGFTYTHATSGRVEPRPVVVPDYDPETGEQTGSHTEWRETTISQDASYITVTAYHYEDIPEPEPTVKDYDDALEDYCREVREARGWTTTDPRTSIGSKVPRWNQDGLDYRDFRDNVLLYGLEVENAFIETGIAPCTLEEFKTHLRTIECHWTYEITEEEQ